MTPFTRSRAAFNAIALFLLRAVPGLVRAYSPDLGPTGFARLKITE